MYKIILIKWKHCQRRGVEQGFSVIQPLKGKEGDSGGRDGCWISFLGCTYCHAFSGIAFPTKKIYLS